MRFAIVATVALVILTNGCVFRGRSSASYRSPRREVHVTTHYRVR